MDGTHPVHTRIDSNQDGKPDRWEYYDEQGKLVKVGLSRHDDGKADAWAFAGPDGKTQRIEVSSASDEKRIDRWSTTTGRHDCGSRRHEPRHCRGQMGTHQSGDQDRGL